MALLLQPIAVPGSDTPFPCNGSMLIVGNSPATRVRVGEHMVCATTALTTLATKEAWEDTSRCRAYLVAGEGGEAMCTRYATIAGTLLTAMRVATREWVDPLIIDGHATVTTPDSTGQPTTGFAWTQALTEGAAVVVGFDLAFELHMAMLAAVVNTLHSVATTMSASNGGDDSLPPWAITPFADAWQGETRQTAVDTPSAAGVLKARLERLEYARSVCDLLRACPHSGDGDLAFVSAVWNLLLAAVYVTMASEKLLCTDTPFLGAYLAYVVRKGPAAEFTPTFNWESAGTDAGTGGGAAKLSRDFVLTARRLATLVNTATEYLDSFFTAVNEAKLVGTTPSQWLRSLGETISTHVTTLQLVAGLWIRRHRCASLGHASDVLPLLLLVAHPALEACAASPRIDPGIWAYVWPHVASISTRLERAFGNAVAAATDVATGEPLAGMAEHVGALRAAAIEAFPCVHFELPIELKDAEVEGLAPLPHAAPLPRVVRAVCTEVARLGSLGQHERLVAPAFQPNAWHLIH
jgi:hypothetical protein